MKQISSLLIGVIILGGCSTFKEYNEDAFPTFTWSPDQIIEFKPVIEDVNATYSLGLGLRHVYGFRQSKVRVSVRIVSPSGLHTLRMYDFQVIDDEGVYVGSCAGDMCDLETIVDTNIQFTEIGQHVVTLQQHEGVKQIAGVMAVGLILDKN
jgi:gliding motility-associated lipoprotein GldH